MRHPVDSVERWQHLQQSSVVDGGGAERVEVEGVFLFLVFGV